MRYAMINEVGSISTICEFPTLPRDAVLGMVTPTGSRYAEIPEEGDNLSSAELLVRCKHIGNGALSIVSPPPGEFFEYDIQLRAWVLDIRKAREVFTASAKQERDAAEFGFFTYNGMTFDGDLDAQRRLSGLVSAAKSAIAAGHTFTKDFTLADNSVVQLTAEDLVGIEMAKLWQVDEAFQVYRAKKAAIDAATTLEELEAITI